MSRNITVTFEDGSTHVYQGAPDDVTPEQVSQRAAQEFGKGVKALDGGRAAAPAAAPVEMGSRARAQQQSAGVLGQAGQDMLSGAVRGAGSIGATILSPFDWAARKLNGGQPIRIGDVDIAGQDRRQGMDQALTMTGANVESVPFAAGKIGAEVAGTLGVGGALAPVARSVGAGPALVQAVRTGGMATGAAPVGLGAKAADMGVRMVGGGITGAGSAAAVDPSQAVAGGVVGAALPPVIKGVGAAARATGGALRITTGELANILKDEPTRAAQDMMRALDLTPEQLPAVIAKLRGAQTLVPGSIPTVAQTLAMPKASILDRLVSAGPGGERLRDAMLAQAEARMAALNGVAPVAPGGAAQMRADTGEAIGRYARPEEARLSGQITKMYEAIDPAGESRITLPLSQMKRAKDKFLGAGTVGSGQDASAIMSEANRIGTQEVPAIKAATPGLKQETLLDFVKRRGGISEQSVAARELSGEVRDLKQSGLGRVVYKNAGRNLSEITEQAYEAGFIPDEDPALLLDMLRNAGKTTYGNGANMDRTYSAMRDAAMGEAPAADRIAVPVPYQQMQNLRSSAGELATQADAKGKTREAAALSKMVEELDTRLNAIADGQGTFDDYFPQAMSDQWRAANASHANKMQRFHTGPQASIFRNGADGQPVVQGGEIASKFWGNRPGLAEDVQSFRRLIDDNPAMLGQFRSMVTTEGAGTASQVADRGLEGKFVKWVEAHAPGLREAFSPEQFQTIQNIAEDARRRVATEGMGKGIGSDSYQKISMGLDGGVFGSPAVRAATQRIPFVSSLAEPARAALEESATKAKAGRLASVLSDAYAAAQALETQQRTPAGAAINSLMNMGDNAWTTPITGIGMSLADMFRVGAYRAPPVISAQ